MAFEATCANRDLDLNILHICHKPFCVQPSHLYEGDSRENAEDSKALRSEMNMYHTFEALDHRHKKAMEAPSWPEPDVEGIPVGFWHST